MTALVGGESEEEEEGRRGREWSLYLSSPPLHPCHSVPQTKRGK